MHTKHQSFKAVVSQTLEHKELVPGVSAFRLTRSLAADGEAPAGFADMLTSTVVAGLAKTVDIRGFESGRAQGLKPSNYRLLSKRYLQVAQERGFMAPCNDKALMEEAHAFDSDPLSAPADYVVVRVDYSANMLFDPQDRALPIGLFFDYTNGMVKDGYYDLPRLVEHLKDNPQIFPPLKSKAIEVKQVPYYNVSPGCHNTVEFYFSPTHEQMQAIWVKAQEIKKRYPSTALREAIFELDMLGLRAAGIARGATYWENKSDGLGAEPDDED